MTGERPTSGYVQRWLPNAGSTGRTREARARSQSAEEGVDIGIISKQLGHASISTTAHYLDHIAPWAVVDAVARRAWGTVH